MIHSKFHASGKVEIQETDACKSKSGYRTLLEDMLHQPKKKPQMPRRLQILNWKFFILASQMTSWLQGSNDIMLFNFHFRISRRQRNFQKTRCYQHFALICPLDDSAGLRQRCLFRDHVLHKMCKS